MELQCLQEALKVEIQCHQKLVAQMKQDPQDGELKKQLHERHDRITALSEKQKMAVRSCPIGGTTKPLSLIKPPPPPSSQSISISVLPVNPATKTAPVAMVTAHMTGGQKVLSGTAAPGSSSSSPPLQTNRGPGGAMLGNLTVVPIKVPQVSSLHRLSGQGNTGLPQVQPESVIPDSLPHSHSHVSVPQEQPASQKQSSSLALSLLSLQRATSVVSPKSHAHSFNHTHSSSHTLIQSHTLGPALPTANSTFSTERLSKGQGDTTSSPPLQSLSLALAWPGGPSTISPTSTSSPTATSASVAPGVTLSVISGSPPAVTGNNNGVWTVSEGVKVQPLVFSTDDKVIIIQPEAETPSSSQDSPGGPQGADSPSQENPSTPPSSTPATKRKKQKDEVPEKMAFMVALGLVTTETLEEIQTKRQERKRRNTANPAYSGLVQPERKRLASNYLNKPLFLSVRDTGDYSWKEELEHDDYCSVCKEDGELQLCHNCPRAYHPDCLHPPLKTPPRGVWVCPKCQKKVLNKENMSWPQNFVQSYVTHKTVREGEKRSLLRRNVELKKECAHLEEQDQKLSKSLTKVMDVRERLIGQQRDTQSSLERLKALIRLIQRDQMIQVTMTATTTTTGASLLSLPWIKPSGSPNAHTAPPAGPSMLLQQKSLAVPQSQSQTRGNN